MKQGIMNRIISGKARHFYQMNQTLKKSLVIAASCFTLLGTTITDAGARTHLKAPVSPVLTASTTAHAGTRSLDFIKNNGQWRSNIKYRANISSGALFLTNQGFVYNFTNEADLKKMDSLMETGASRQVKDEMTIHQYAYKVNFVGANLSDDFEPKLKRSYYNNYIIGRDRSKWQGFVPLYGMVTQKSIYQGIDLVVYSKDNAPKYDFLVAPGANPGIIQLGFEGIEPELAKDGNIKLKTTFSEIQENAPVAYQTIDGQKIDVPVKYKLQKNRVSLSSPMAIIPHTL